MTRQEANREILKYLTMMIELVPDWRFHQILQNMNIVKCGEDQWYEESDDTLSMLKLKNDIELLTKEYGELTK